MQLSTVRQAPQRTSEPRMLLPGALRAAGIAVLGACAATAILAGGLAGRGEPGWLDSAVDPRIQAALSRFPVLLNWLPKFGELKPVALATLLLALAFVVTRRWSGAVLAQVAVPVASGLTEYVLKPYVGRMLGQGFPSGHATAMFALTAIWAIFLVDPTRYRLPGPLRLLLFFVALLFALAVPAAMIAIGAHTLTDVIAGVAVGTGVVLACALSLDLVASRVRRERSG
jgi:membrane-associated phospholipid phosphatase